jgi:hypothetical protein
MMMIMNLITFYYRFQGVFRQRSRPLVGFMRELKHKMEELEAMYEEARGKHTQVRGVGRMGGMRGGMMMMVVEGRGREGNVIFLHSEVHGEVLIWFS